MSGQRSSISILSIFLMVFSQSAGPLLAGQVSARTKAKAAAPVPKQAAAKPAKANPQWSPALQQTKQQLLELLATLGKPVVAVLTGGSPLSGATVTVRFNDTTNVNSDVTGSFLSCRDSRHKLITAPATIINSGYQLLNSGYMTICRIRMNKPCFIVLQALGLLWQSSALIEV